MFFSRSLLCTFFVLIFHSLLTGADLDFESYRAAGTETLFEDLQQAVSDASDGDTIVFSTDVNIPFDEQITLNKAVSFKSLNNSNVIFDGRHRTRLFNIFDVPAIVDPSSGNGLKDISFEGINLVNANSVSTWEIINEDLSTNSVSYDPDTDTWVGADKSTVFGVDSLYTEHPEGGAIYAEFVNLKFINVKITSSYSVISGAAVYLFNGSLDIENCEISENFATCNIPVTVPAGPTSIIGGIICHNSGYIESDFEVKSSKISNNLFKNKGRALYTRGALIYSRVKGPDVPYKFVIDNSEITQNKIIFNTDGGAPIYGTVLYRSTEFHSLQGEERISNCSISANDVNGALNNTIIGGAIHYFKPVTVGSSLDIFNNTVTQNTGNRTLINFYGAAENKVRLYNNSILKNSATTHTIFNTLPQLELRGNILGFNGVELSELKADESSLGGNNFIQSGRTIPFPGDLDSTLSLEDLKLAEISSADNSVIDYFIPLDSSPLLDSAPIPSPLPTGVNLATDQLGNAFSGTNRDIGSVDKTLLYSIYTGENHVGGTVSPENYSYVLPGLSKTINITPTEGYTIETIDVNSVPVTVSDFGGMSYTITDINEDKIVSTSFIETNRFVYMEEGEFDGQQWVNGDGSITPVPAPPLPEPWVLVPYDSSQAFLIESNEFYLIDRIVIKDGYTGEVIREEPVTDLYSQEVTIDNITEDLTIQATFVDGRRFVYMEEGEFDGQQWVNGDGSITPVPAPPLPEPWVLVPYDSSQTFLIESNEFYLIDRIVIKDGYTGEVIREEPVTDLYSQEVTIDNITEDLTIQATFVDGRRFVYMEEGEFDGQQWVNGDGSITPVPAPPLPEPWVLVPYDSSQTFLIESNEFYLIDRIVIKDGYTGEVIREEPVTDLYSQEVTVDNITEDLTIQATFIDGRRGVYMVVGEYDPMQQQHVKDEGEIVPLPGPAIPESSVLVAYNSSQTFRVRADEFYLIESIQIFNDDTGELMRNEPVTDLYQMDVTIDNITANLTIQATFIDGRSEVSTFVGEDSGGVIIKNEGSISPNEATLVAYNQNHSFTVTPNPGFKIEKVTVVKEQDESETDLEIEDPFLFSYTVAEITGRVEIKATFVEYSPSIYSIASGYVDPDTGHLMPAQGSITPEGDTLVTYGSDQSYSIVPDSGYKISSIVVDGVPQIISNVYTEIYIFENVITEHTISVNFEELPHEVNVAILGNGSATPEVKKVDDGEDLTVELLADQGFVLDKISVNGIIQSISGQPESYSLQLNAISEDMEVTAYFIEEPVLESGLAYAGTEDWTTVNTNRHYDSMVVVTTPIMTINDPTYCIRVSNVTATGFDVKLSRLDNSIEPLAGVPFTYFIVEEGVYTLEEDGVSMEAVKFNSTVTDRRGSWYGESRSYANSYNVPVVLGQVMTANDPEWSVFWSRGSARGNIPDAATLRVGKHVGEDSNNSRLDETVGYIVLETGSYVYGSSTVTAKVGIDKVDGVQNNGYSYTDLPEADFVVASQAAMDGNDGGFAVLHGDYVPVNGALSFAINEDTLRDSERKHTTEQVAWLALKELSSTTALNDNSKIVELIATGNVILNDFLTENVTIVLKTDVTDGELLLDPDGQFQYVSNSGLADSFEYELKDIDGNIVSTGTVSLNP